MTDARVHSAFLMMIPVLPLVAVSFRMARILPRETKYDSYRDVPDGGDDSFGSLLTLFFVWLFLPYGLELAAAGAVLGMVAGECAGLLLLGSNSSAIASASPGSAILHDQALINGSRKQPVKEVLHTAIPVTGSKMIGSLSYLLESILTVRSLVVAGVTAAVATAQYGALQGMVIPLLFLPGALPIPLPCRSCLRYPKRPPAEIGRRSSSDCTNP